MATWHQNRAGLGGLYRPHPTAWGVVINPPHGFACGYLKESKAEAEALAARLGGVLIPPQAAPGDGLEGPPRATA